MLGKEFKAYHEAGHALIAIGLDVPIDYVTILPQKFDEGHLKLTCSPNVSTGGMALISLAGPLASELYMIMAFGSADRDLIIKTGRKDFSRVLEIQESDMGDLGAAIYTIVNAKWEAIEAIATKLLDHYTLTESQVLEVLQPFLPIVSSEAPATEGTDV